MDRWNRVKLIDPVFRAQILKVNPHWARNPRFHRGNDASRQIAGKGFNHDVRRPAIVSRRKLGIPAPNLDPVQNLLGGVFCPWLQPDKGFQIIDKQANGKAVFARQLPRKAQAYADIAVIVDHLAKQIDGRAVGLVVGLSHFFVPKTLTIARTLWKKKGLSGSISGMTEIRFYHPMRRRPEQVLPDLLERALAKGLKIVVRAANDEDAKRLDALLWTEKPESFIPHGLASEGSESRQPILITGKTDMPIAAEMLVLMPGTIIDPAQPFPDSVTLCCEMLDDANAEQIAASRQHWKAWKDQGHTITYWQQTDQGKWEQKA
jgi:DNA polymerase-3 subunit chi